MRGDQVSNLLKKNPLSWGDLLSRIFNFNIIGTDYRKDSEIGLISFLEMGGNSLRDYSMILEEETGYISCSMRPRRGHNILRIKKTPIVKLNL